MQNELNLRNAYRLEVVTVKVGDIIWVEDASDYTKAPEKIMVRVLREGEINCGKGFHSVVVEDVMSGAEFTPSTVYSNFSRVDPKYLENMIKATEQKLASLKHDLAVYKLLVL